MMNNQSRAFLAKLVDQILRRIIVQVRSPHGDIPPVDRLRKIPVSFGHQAKGRVELIAVFVQGNACGMEEGAHMPDRHADIAFAVSLHAVFVELVPQTTLQVRFGEFRQ
jgi:hypothetical protein